MKELSSKSEYEDLYGYFLEHRKSLEKRDDQKRAPKGTPFYQIFRISKDKIDSPKVAFSLVSTRLEAAIIPAKMKDNILGETRVLVDHSAYFFSINSPEEVYFLCAMLNSTALRCFAYDLGFPKGGVPYKQFYLWTIAILPIPHFSSKNPLHNEIVASAKTYEKIRNSGNQTKDSQLQAKERDLNHLIMKAYGLEKKELELLERHHELLRGAHWRTDSEKKVWLKKMKE
ncbi:MAG: hypothetical protein ACE5OZ_17160 [Candidatus Heimdallarchaeota archaeon]